MVIDFHTHVFPDDIAAKVVETLKGKTKERVEPAGDGTMRQLMRQMGAAGIDRAVLCPIATRPEQFESILRFSLAITSGELGDEERKALIPFASVHPGHPDCLKQLDKAAHAGIRGIKIHPFYQQFSLGTEHTRSFLSRCRDLNLIVLCHCGQDIGFPPAHIGTPEQVARLHDALEGIHFIAAHLGGWRMWRDALKFLAGRPIYLDTSVLEADLHTDEVQEILHTHPADYLLMASDWPWCALDKAAGLVRNAHRSEEQKSLILGGNAQRLLNGLTGTHQPS